MNCLLCKNSKFIVEADKLRNDNKTRVKKCLKCGLFRLDPIPSNAQIEKAYNTTAKSIPVDNKKRLSFKKEFSLRDTIFNSDLICSLVKKGSEILDFGCGYGFFLQEMKRRGYKVSGVDLSLIRLAAVKQKISDVRVSNRVEYFSGKKFDCITAFHVLEHVTDPIALLKLLGTYLKPKGVMVIEVPNLDDNMLGISREYKDFYWKKEHISYFNEKTLKLCVKRAGIRVIKKGFIQRWDLSNLMNWIIRKGPQPDKEIIDFIKNKKIKWLDDYYKNYLAKNKKADAIFLVLKK